MEGLEIITKNIDETINLARVLAKNMVPPKIICLNGDLGAGKTAFSKGFAKGLGVVEEITSPTFTIMNSYRGTFPLYHFDMYRLESEDDLYELGLFDYLNLKTLKGFSLIEWPRLNIKQPHLEINIEKIDDTTRRITIEAK